MTAKKAAPKPRRNRSAEINPAKKRQLRGVEKKTVDEAKALAKQGLGEYTTLALGELTLGTYQRPLNRAWAKAIADTYNPALFEPLHVALRADNKYYVVDGQHRLEAARIIGLQRVPCMLYIDMDEAHEAEQFVALQERRQMLMQQDRFHARIVAGDPVAIGISQLLAKHGYAITKARSSGTNEFVAVQALERVYRVKPSILDDTLWILREAWNGSKESMSARLVDGIARFLRAHGDRINHQELALKMRSLEPADIALRASIMAKSMRCSQGVAIAQTLHELYNRNKPASRRIGGAVV